MLRANFILCGCSCHFLIIHLHVLLPLICYEATSIMAQSEDCAVQCVGKLDYWTKLCDCPGYLVLD